MTISRRASYFELCFVACVMGLRGLRGGGTAGVSLVIVEGLEGVLTDATGDHATTFDQRRLFFLGIPLIGAFERRRLRSQRFSSRTVAPPHAEGLLLLKALDTASPPSSEASLKAAPGAPLCPLLLLREAAMADSGGITTDGDREAEEQKALAAARKLPMGDRLAHKIWKARLEACEELLRAAEGALSPSDPALDEPLEHLSKCAADSNATVMDKGLEAAAAVLTRGSEQHAARCAEGLCKAIMSKGLTARPGTLKKAEEVLLLLVEQEQQGQVVEALVQQGFAHKTPKAVAAAVNTALTVFDQFGARAVKPTPVLSKLPALFDSRDAKVRDGAKKLTVLLGRWVGREAVEGSLMEKMRDAMKKDVQGWLEDLPDEKPKAQRFTRKEQVKRKAKEEAAAKAAAEGAVEGDSAAAAASGTAAVTVAVPGDDDDEEEDCGLDAWEISEPKDVLKDLTGEFWSSLKSAKWKERKDALGALRALLKQNPRLEPGADYHDVTGELKKVVTKDSNVSCVAEAVGCVGAVAKGLRGPYKAQAKDLYPHILDKFKEKNSGVVAACHEALNNMEAHSFQVGPLLPLSLFLSFSHPPTYPSWSCPQRSCLSTFPQFLASSSLSKRPPKLPFDAPSSFPASHYPSLRKDTRSICLSVSLPLSVSLSPFLLPPSLRLSVSVSSSCPPPPPSPLRIVPRSSPYPCPYHHIHSFTHKVPLACPEPLCCLPLRPRTAPGRDRRHRGRPQAQQPQGAAGDPQVPPRGRPQPRRCPRQEAAQGAAAAARQGGRGADPGAAGRRDARPRGVCLQVRVDGAAREGDGSPG